MEQPRFVSPRRYRQNRRRFFQGPHLILFLIIFLLLGGILAIIIQSSWSIFISVSFGALAALLTAASWLFPRNSTAPRHQVGLDPPDDPITIIKRQKNVQEIYNQLIDINTSAIILRGLNGIGTSTLAQQVCSYAENLRLRGMAPFFDSPLWIHLDTGNTISDLARVLSLPGLSSPTSQGQTEPLLRHLNTPKMRRLIVLDFKNPLNQQTKDALADLPGFKEFLSILNNQGCECRILLTSRPWSSEDSNEPLNYIKEYHVDGLTYVQGIALLQQYGVEGKYDELRQAIMLCDGHAGALTILPRLLTEPPAVELTTLLEEPVYRGMWMQEIAKEFLAHIYRDLSPIEQELLFAFSIYRRPVTLEAAKAIMTSKSEERLLKALRKLIRCNFFLNSTEINYYQLHLIVANHAQNDFGDPGNQTHLQEAHKKAARYYQRVAKSYIPFGQHSEHIELLIEVLYHLYQAGEVDEAYDLFQREKLLPHLL